MVPLFFEGCGRQWGEFHVEMNLIDFVEREHLKNGEKIFVFEIEALGKIEQHAAVFYVRVIDYL